MLGIGLRSTREPLLPRGLLLAFPLFGLISLTSINGLPNPGVVWPSFLIGYSVGMMLAYRAQKQWNIAREGAFLRVKGEWLTLFVLMVIFWANFVGGAMQTLSPESYESAAFLVVFTAITAAASGSFLGRAISALRYSEPEKTQI